MENGFDLEKYKKAIEKTLTEIPVENGGVTLEAIWLETAIPEDILLEVVQNGELELPVYVERIVTRGGQVLFERPAEPSDNHHDGAGRA
jgi:hypothetical protein